MSLSSKLIIAAAKELGAVAKPTSKIAIKEADNVLEMLLQKVGAKHTARILNKMPATETKKKLIQEAAERIAKYWEDNNMVAMELTNSAPYVKPRTGFIENIGTGGQMQGKGFYATLSGHGKPVQAQYFDWIAEADREKIPVIYKKLFIGKKKFIGQLVPDLDIHDSNKIAERYFVKYFKKHPEADYIPSDVEIQLNKIIKRIEMSRHANTYLGNYGAPNIVIKNPNQSLLDISKSPKLKNIKFWSKSNSFEIEKLSNIIKNRTEQIEEASNYLYGNGVPKKIINEMRNTSINIDDFINSIDNYGDTNMQTLRNIHMGHLANKNDFRKINRLRRLGSLGNYAFELANKNNEISVMPFSKDTNITQLVGDNPLTPDVYKELIRKKKIATLLEQVRELWPQG
jgi:hypothetical protein